MRALIRTIRERYHPLYYARKSRLGRSVIRRLDRPAWLSLPGVRFRVRGRLLTHGVAYSLVGSQEKGPEALIRACLHQFKIRSFWDVGSNIGYYAWLMKSAAPELELVLIEPLAANAALIRATLEREGFSNTELIVAGASDHGGVGLLRADQLAGSTSTFETQGQTFEERHMDIPSERFKVPLVAIDEVRDSHGPIDFMKIDVEGHEESVLRGGPKDNFPGSTNRLHRMRTPGALMPESAKISGVPNRGCGPSEP